MLNAGVRPVVQHDPDRVDPQSTRVWLSLSDPLQQESPETSRFRNRDCFKWVTVTGATSGFHLDRNDGRSVCSDDVEFP